MPKERPHPWPSHGSLHSSCYGNRGREGHAGGRERRGIGTPATRAAILEKLIDTKLVERVGDRRKRVLLPTDKGKALIAVLPEKLRSAQLTAEWEQRLKRIEQGLEQPEDFMRDIRQMVIDLTRDTRRAEDADQLFPPLRERIGSCPKCGAAITNVPRALCAKPHL